MTLLELLRCKNIGGVIPLLYFLKYSYKGGVVMKKLLKVLANSEFQGITVGLVFKVTVLVIVNRWNIGELVLPYFL